MKRLFGSDYMYLSNFLLLGNPTKTLKAGEYLLIVIADLVNFIVLLLDACTNMIAVNTELLAIEGGCVLLPNVTHLLVDVGTCHT